MTRTMARADYIREISQLAVKLVPYEEPYLRTEEIHRVMFALARRVTNAYTELAMAQGPEKAAKTIDAVLLRSEEIVMKTYGGK